MDSSCVYPSLSHAMESAYATAYSSRQQNSSRQHTTTPAFLYSIIPPRSMCHTCHTTPTSHPHHIYPLESELERDSDRERDKRESESTLASMAPRTNAVDDRCPAYFPIYNSYRYSCPCRRNASTPKETREMVQQCPHHIIVHSILSPVSDTWATSPITVSSFFLLWLLYAGRLAPQYYSLLSFLISSCENKQRTHTQNRKQKKEKKQRFDETKLDASMN